MKIPFFLFITAALFVPACFAAQSPAAADPCSKAKAALPAKTLREIARAEKLEDFQKSAENIVKIPAKRGSGLGSPFVLKTKDGIMMYQIPVAGIPGCSAKTMMTYRDRFGKH